jgi:hypothetical protein
VCKKSARFNFKRPETRKSRFWGSEGSREQRTRVHWRTRVRDILSQAPTWKVPWYMYSNMVQAGTSTRLGPDENLLGPDENQKRQSGNTCLPCTTDYDSDNTWVGIDSLSTYCITNDLRDFTETPTSIRREVRGIQNIPATITYVGRGSFAIIDDDGQNCEIKIKQLYYYSSASVKILSPQHVDKMWRDDDNKNFFTATINSDGCKIEWMFKGHPHSRLK